MYIYGLSILTIVLSAVFYFAYRDGVNTYLRIKKNSKTYIKKSKKGFRNFWLFEKIHKEQNLGLWYYLNIAYLLLLLIVSFVVITVGYLRVMQIPVVVMIAVLSIVETVAIGFWIVNNNIGEYGTPFVLYQKSSFGKPHTIVLDMLAIIHPLLFVYLLLSEVIGNI